MTKHPRAQMMRLAAMLLLVTLGFVAGLSTRHGQPALAPTVVAAASRPAATPTVDPALAADPPPAKEKTPVIRVVESTSPAVVTVGAVKRTITRQPWIDSYFFPSWRYIESRSRVPYMGSGFLIDTQGHVITNFHVIEDSVSLFVTFPDGREFPARLVEADHFIDLAMLRIDAGDATLPEPLKLGDSDTLMIGEQVLALGNPFGNLLEDSRPTVTVGYVSALSRDFRPDAQNQRVYQGMIQTDAAINPGNSGGPLVDLTGRVVGVNTFIFSPSGGSTGVGFALPINRVRAFVDEVRTFGRLRPLLLDFEVRSVRGRNNLRAVQIVSIDNTGPAMQAGLQLGDVIIEADGRPITSREEFRVLFASKQIGDTVRFRVLRGNDLVDVTYHVREARI